MEAIWGFEKVWETWVVDVQVVEDARRSRNAVAGGGGGGTSGSSPDESEWRRGLFYKVQRDDIDARATSS